MYRKRLVLAYVFICVLAIGCCVVYPKQVGLVLVVVTFADLLTCVYLFIFAIGSDVVNKFDPEPNIL